MPWSMVIVALSLCQSLALAVRVVRAVKVIKGGGTMVHGGVRDQHWARAVWGRYRFTRRRYHDSTAAINFEAGSIMRGGLYKSEIPEF